jgi:hypothetical protein
MFVKFACHSVARPLTLGALLLLALVLCAPMTQAAPILPSQLVTPGGPAVGVPLTSAAPGNLLAFMDVPFSFSTTAGTTSGNLRSAVYRNPSGTIDFYYQVFNNMGSVTALSRESDTSFSGFTTWVAFRTDASALTGTGFTTPTAGIIPVTADRDSSATTVGFNFVPTPPGTKVPPGTTTAVLIISTDATSYTQGNAEVIDGGTVTVAAFQPSSGVPEPATLALIGGGLLALAAIRRRTARS